MFRNLFVMLSMLIVGNAMAMNKMDKEGDQFYNETIGHQSSIIEVANKNPNYGGQHNCISLNIANNNLDCTQLFQYALEITPFGKTVKKLTIKFGGINEESTQKTLGQFGRAFTSFPPEKLQQFCLVGTKLQNPMKLNINSLLGIPSLTRICFIDCNVELTGQVPQDIQLKQFKAYESVIQGTGSIFAQLYEQKTLLDELVIINSKLDNQSWPFVQQLTIINSEVGELPKKDDKWCLNLNALTVIGIDHKSWWPVIESRKTQQLTSLTFDGQDAKDQKYPIVPGSKLTDLTCGQLQKEHTLYQSLLNNLPVAIAQINGKQVNQLTLGKKEEAIEQALLQQQQVNFKQIIENEAQKLLQQVGIEKK